MLLLGCGAISVIYLITDYCVCVCEYCEVERERNFHKQTILQRDHCLALLRLCFGLLMEGKGIFVFTYRWPIIIFNDDSIFNQAKLRERSYL